jgi:carotenoid cleavage dioxygenase-like enzyme
LHPDGRLDHRVLFADHAELPRLHDARYAGQPYRYAYAARDSGGGQFLDSLVKFDLQRETSQSWHSAGTYPGEPVFVPAPDAAGEDEGVILSVVLDPASETSFLLVLDAARFQEIARAEVPHSIPFGFHGSYFGDGTSENGA